MEIKTYAADEIMKLTRVKPWKKTEGPTDIWKSLGVTLTLEQQAKIKFAPNVEMAAFENPKTGRYEGWRTGGGSWATIFALTPDDKVICVIEYKHGIEEVVIGLPAGNISPNEDPAEGVRRELLEETGLTVGKILPLGDPTAGTGVACRKTSARYFGFATNDLTKTGEASPDEDEDIETAYVPLSEWLIMIDRGIVREGSAISTTFMGLRKLGKL